MSIINSSINDMKRFLLFFGLLITSVTFAQNLSLSQLMTLRKMSLEDAEIKLNNEGWQYSRGKAPVLNRLGHAEFVYGAEDDFQFAEAFLSFLYGTDSESRVVIQFSKLSKYRDYLTEVKGFSPTLIKNNIEEGNLVKVYQGKTTTFIFTSATTENKFGGDMPSWTLAIMDNESYNLNYSEQ